MIHQLQKIYPSLVTSAEQVEVSEQSYRWFLTEQDDLLGIREDELTAKDVAVLSTFLSPHTINLPVPTEEEKKWRKRILSTDKQFTSEAGKGSSYRFIYFSLQNNQVDPVLFKDAVHELFAKKTPILWLTGFEGIIVDEKTACDESISFEQIIDVLMSDLYMKIKLFVGPYLTGFEKTAAEYQCIVHDAKIVFSTTTKRVITYLDAISYLLLEQIEPAFRTRIAEAVLQEYVDDEETLHMIETLLQCNLNISEAAKGLHMHRNSLQYRLDRFYEKTGTDIRLFHNAMTVHLALLASK